jgi:acyl carrier protein
MSPSESELKKFIVEALMLDDVTPEEIDSEAPLFVEGLGLDSVDALELGMAVARRYKIKISPKDPGNREAFFSVRALAAFIDKNRDQEMP